MSIFYNSETKQFYLNTTHTSYVMEIYEKLALVQEELKAPKTEFNAFGKFAYRTAENILQAVKPIAKRHGCVVILTDTVELVGEKFFIKSKVSYASEEIINFIANEKDPNVQSNWDAYYKKLDQLGRTELEKIAQAAYTRKTSGK